MYVLFEGEVESTAAILNLTKSLVPSSFFGVVASYRVFAVILSTGSETPLEFIFPYSKLLMLPRCPGSPTPTLVIIPSFS